MTATAEKRNFNRFDGRERDAGFAPGVERRMAGQARRAESERRAAAKNSQRNPVRVPHDQVVIKNGEIEATLISRSFLSEAISRLEIHLARGHWEQAKQTIDALAEQWELRKIAENASVALVNEKLGWHVANVFEPRIANTIEHHCSGTLGSLLECFPAAFVGASQSRNCGPITIRKIAERLMKLGLLSEQEAAAKIAEYNAAMEVR